MTFVRESEELVEAPSKRVVGSSPAEMPLSDDPRDIARPVQSVREGRFADWKPVFRVLVPGPDRIELVSETGRNAPGEQSGPRGTAVGTGDIAGRESHAARGDRIDVRRRDLGVSLAAEFAVSQIIGKDDDDVRFSERAGAVLAGGGRHSREEQEDRNKTRSQQTGRRRVHAGQDPGESTAQQ